MTSNPIRNACARNLPQHFNGCACTTDPRIAAVGPDLDLVLVLVQSAPTFSDPTTAPRTGQVAAYDLSKGQHVLFGDKVQILSRRPQPSRVGGAILTLHGMKDEEFHCTHSNMVTVLDNGDDYEPERIQPADVSPGDLIVLLGNVHEVESMKDSKTGTRTVFYTDGFSSSHHPGARNGTTQVLTRLNPRTS